MRTFFCIITMLCIGFVGAQENNSNASDIGIELQDKSDQGLLKEAIALKLSDPNKSTDLAKTVLQVSKDKQNFSLNAQAHSLLAELALNNNDVVQALQHYLTASLIYRDIKDKRYENTDKTIDELLPIAQQNDETWAIASILLNQAKIEYKKKHYDDAIIQYFHAINFLSDPDKKIQKKLGETYKKIAESYKRLKNREKTASYYKKALSVFTAIDDKKNMASTLNTLAEAERYLGNYSTALDYSVRALAIHQQIDDPEGRAKAFNGAGIIYRYIERYDKALEHAYEAHLYYKQVNDPSGIAKTSNQMGLIYTRLKQFEQARSFYQLTIDLPEEQIEPKTLASALREMSVIDLNSGHYDTSMAMIKKAYQIYQSENNKTNQSLAARLIGNVYRAQGNDQKAIDYYRKSLSIAIEVGSQIYQIKAELPLGSRLIGKDNDEAIDLLESALASSIEMNLKSYQLYAYRELRLAEKSRGNLEQSLQYAEKEIALSDVIHDETEDNELVLMKAKLYSHKKEMELESLKEKAKLVQLELAKKTNEVELAEQERTISELELAKNKYASVALASLSAVCVFVVIFIYRGFTQSRKRNKELDYLAARDPLTGCYNRRILFEILDRDFADLDLLTNYSIIIIDIDYFKNVNDTYGHIAGDTVLCGLANILNSNVRKKDTVARFGGEEFCIVLPGVSDAQGMAIAEVIRQKIAESRFDDIAITCSFGVTSTEFNAKTPTELIHQADLALYKSKLNGRNTVTLWHPDEEV